MSISNPKLVNQILIILYYFIIDELKCQVLCQYYSEKPSEILIPKLTKELQINSEKVDFENDLIQFDDIDINDGIIYFYFVINKSVLQETNTDTPTYNRLFLRDIGEKKDPVELSFFVGNYTTFKISVKIYKGEKIKEKDNNIKNVALPLLSQIINPIIKKKSEGIKTSDDNNQTAENEGKDKQKGLARKGTFLIPDSFDSGTDKNLDENKDKENEKDNYLNIMKRYSSGLNGKEIESLEPNLEFQENQYYLKGIPYDTYLSNFKNENKKKIKIDRETFCDGFFIASFPQKKGKIIEDSCQFAATCGHRECSAFPSMKPEIIARYPLKDTDDLELNNLAATICFPTGIKVCFLQEKHPSKINDYIAPIVNAKNERYYMVTYYFYHKIINKDYNKLYEIEPINHLLKKAKRMSQDLVNIIEKNIECFLENGYAYVPYCMCLISKYPYIKEMKKCLQSIYSMIINNLNESNTDLNNLIMHLIHSVPIPEKETIVNFYIPYFNNSIQLNCPKINDIKIVNNISNLLKIFSIDNLVIILRLMVSEKRVLFIDDDYERLSSVIDNCLSLLYPFQWENTYIPILSYEMIQYLQSSHPFINGIHISLLPLVKPIFEEIQTVEENQGEAHTEVFLIYINQNKFELGSSLLNNKVDKNNFLKDNVPNLPIRLENELKEDLKKLNEKLIQKKDLIGLDLKVRNSFINLFVKMFHDYHKYITFIDKDVVFNKSLFLEKIDEKDKEFYDSLFETQSFQQFCQNIIKDELTYFKTMIKNFDSVKIEKPSLSSSLIRKDANTFIHDKMYIIRPEYLKIKEQNLEKIEEIMKSKYKLNEKVDEEGMIISNQRIVSEFGRIKDEDYKINNCLIYIVPEKEIQKESKFHKYISNELTKDKIFSKVLNIFKTKSKSNDKNIEEEKEKENIKEIIIDFTTSVFSSDDIEYQQSFRKDLESKIYTPFGMKFFTEIILSKNLSDITLLNENSFFLIGNIIFNILLTTLKFQESKTLLEQMIILMKSMKYLGKESNGKTKTLWEEYINMIRSFPKIKQANFWEKWYEMEIKKEDSNKEKIIGNLCDIMIDLHLDNLFIAEVLKRLIKREFGKKTEKTLSVYHDVLSKIMKDDK